MAVFTSSQFASAAASGTDWRDTSKAILEKLESVKTADAPFNLGFLYVSDHLVDEAENILNLFRSVLGVRHWTGAVGVGVCGVGEEFIDRPAISAMIGTFANDDFCPFPAGSADLMMQQGALKLWLERNDPLLVFVHGDPLADEDPAVTLKKIENFSSGFLMGGLSSSRHNQVQFSGIKTQNNGISGIAFSQNVKVATSLSQGCMPIGPVHNITSGDEHMIHELDSKPVLEVFEEEIRTMAIKKIERDPDTIMVPEAAMTDTQQIPEEFQSLFKGEVSVAFPVSGTDQNDYLVRNIIGVNEENALMVAQRVAGGDTVRFVYRDHETIRQDLSKTLLDLRERVIRDHGEFRPRGAIYISCAARAFYGTGNPEHSEMRLVHEIIGDVPLAGFYAGGEICNARLYGYTGVLTLFL